MLKLNVFLLYLLVTRKPELLFNIYSHFGTLVKMKSDSSHNSGIAKAEIVHFVGHWYLPILL